MADLPYDVRRRLDEIFGDVLPAVTRDEVPEAEPAAHTDGTPAVEQWLRDNRPPHHDRG
ncbi:hypothetical protein [Pseudonocardia asaccharolytica]|uniref:Uncharacterized protein n=1 Tax=Pseudonocardia asaccharolytica DSM 44247 = NBRC 16224 TaxID=1123024 RepID=A0A511D2K7_9PSEU|nr:hypothetical protein [Pseudonocardia asaccharolytica]GEL18753.1 hypothetical protein PA7_25900 [Pseudonocardia asaccharolytica DSM 44247 = NBRC 16224]